MRKLLIAITVLVALGGSQTKIDIGKQTRGDQELRPPFPAPLRTGSELPASCEAGELFFLLGAIAGSNLYVCHAEGQWATQGSAGLGNFEVQNDGTTVAARSRINFVPGLGLIQVVADFGSRVDVQQTLDTSTVQTLAAAQRGDALRCASTGTSSTAFECAMLPTLLALTPGMVIHWTPNLTNDSAGITLDIDSLGPHAIKLSDGIADPRATSFKAGANYLLWFDGISFRTIEQPALERYLTFEDAQSYRGNDCVSASASPSIYTCALNPALPSYEAGFLLRWRPDVDAAGGAVTLSIDGLGARPVALRDGSTGIAPGDIKAGELYLLWYDGSAFRVVQSPPRGLATAAEVQSGSLLLCESTAGDGTQYACTLAASPESLTRGAILHWIPNVGSAGGAIELNANGLGAKPVLRPDGSATWVAGEIADGRLYELWYDGVSFRLLSGIAPVISTDALPSCTEELRGRLWLLRGASLVSDEISVCAKDAADAFEWRPLH